MEQQTTRTGPTPGAPLPPPAPFRLVRARDGVLGGVCSGLAAQAGVDVTLVRLAFVAAGLAGFGVIAYILLWIVVPREDPAAGRTLMTAPPDTARWLRVALVVGAVLGLSGLLGGPLGWGWGGPDDAGPGFLVGVFLIGAGIAYLLSRSRRDPRPLPPPSVPAAGVRAGSWAPPTPGSQPPTARRVAPAPTASPATGAIPTSSAAPAERTAGAGLIAARVVGWLTVIAMPLAAVVVGTMVAVGALSMRWPGLVGAAWFAAFVALVATTAGARRAWPVLVSLALVLGATGLAIGLTSWHGGVGERVTSPTTPAEVSTSYELAAGRRVLDLSELRLDEDETSVTVDQGVGQVEVVVPDGAEVFATVEVGIGEARVLGRAESGFDVDLALRDSPEVSSGRLGLDVDLGIGQVVVCRASTTTGGEAGCDL